MQWSDANVQKSEGRRSIAAAGACKNVRERVSEGGMGSDARSVLKISEKSDGPSNGVGPSLSYCSSNDCLSVGSGVKRGPWPSPRPCPARARAFSTTAAALGAAHVEIDDDGVRTRPSTRAVRRSPRWHHKRTRDPERRSAPTMMRTATSRESVPRPPAARGKALGVQ